jgi:hypothetical protein
MTTPIDLHSFDVTRVTIEEPFELTKTGNNKNKTRKCTIRYKGAPLIMQTPRVRLPFCFRDDPQDTTVSGSIVTPEDAYGVQFRAVLSALDELFVNSATERTAAWFPKVLTREAIVESYKSPYKTPEKYTPTFKMKFIRQESGAGGFDVWNNKRELVEMPLEKCFEKYAELVCIVECTGIWLQPSLGWGCNWRIRQLKHFAPQRGYAFLDDGEVSVVPDEDDECALVG